MLCLPPAAVHTHMLQYADWHSATSNTQENRNVSLVSPSYTFVLSGLVCVCVCAHIWWATFTTPLDGSKVYSQTHTCAVAVVDNTVSAAWERQHMKCLAEQEEDQGKGEEGECGKWQEDIGRLIVWRSSPGDLGRVRSQGLWPPRALHCQGNCATILTLHCLNPPSILPPSIPLSFFNSLFPLLKLRRSRDLLSTLMMSAPQRRHLSSESQQLAFKVLAWPGPGGWRRRICPLDDTDQTTSPPEGLMLGRRVLILSLCYWRWSC